MTTPILCYHKVGLAEAEERFLNTEPADFDRQVRYFKRRGYRFVTARELAGEWPRRAVCFTFDDAYASALENAAPSLLEAGGTGTFYVNGGHIGMTSSWDADRQRPLADWDSLRWAWAHGFELGNHTFSHARLTECEPDVVREEIERGRDALAEFGLGSFCYPYGACDAAVQQAVRRAGYNVAMALGKRRARLADDRLALPRIVMAYSDGMAGLMYKLHIKPLIRK